MRIVRRVYSKVVEVFLSLLSVSWVEKLSDELLRLRFRTQEVSRQRRARNTSLELPVFNSKDGNVLARSVLEKSTPWRDMKFPMFDVPGMLTESEKRYYTYITKFYTGAGAVVELGPWLGLSTSYLVSGLKENPHFSNQKLHVFDDYTWRCSWMDKWLKGTEITPLSNHSSFKELFLEQLGDLAEHIVAKRQKICDYDGNESCLPLEWNGGDIELLVVDCGRSLAVNEGWWQVFSPNFMPNRTLIVMQDWQNHKQVPEVFWENTKIFTDSKEGMLDMVHEVRNAGIATFLYKGKA